MGRTGLEPVTSCVSCSFEMQRNYCLSKRLRRAALSDCSKGCSSFWLTGLCVAGESKLAKFPFEPTSYVLLSPPLRHVWHRIIDAGHFINQVCWQACVIVGLEVAADCTMCAFSVELAVDKSWLLLN